MSILAITVLFVSKAFAKDIPPAFESLCPHETKCDDLLIVVDGTGSRSWIEQCPKAGIQWTSHSHRFYEDYNGSKLYWHGPDASESFTAGKQVRAIIESAYVAICEANATTVDLIGHSRGGYTVMELARKLESSSCWNSASPKLRFMGLYDPVSDVGTDVFSDSIFFIHHPPIFGDHKYYKSSSMMPRNVELISISYRDHKLNSRWFFKTCYDKHDKDKEWIHAETFVCTHGGTGGTPGKGDYKELAIIKGHDIETEVDQSIMADLHVREGALLQRVPITATSEADYANMRKCAIDATKTKECAN